MCAKLETKKQKRTRNSLIRFLFVKKKNKNQTAKKKSCTKRKFYLIPAYIFILRFIWILYFILLNEYNLFGLVEM